MHLHILSYMPTGTSIVFLTLSIKDQPQAVSTRLHRLEESFLAYASAKIAYLSRNASKFDIFFDFIFFKQKIYRIIKILSAQKPACLP